MTRKIKKYMLVLVFITLILPTNSFSKYKPGWFGLSALIGGHSFEGNQPIESGPMMALGFEYPFSEVWSGEFMVNFGNHNFFYYDSSQNTVNEGDISVMNLHVDALYHLNPKNRLVPYLALGLGYLSYGDDRMEDDNPSFFNYGLGLKYFINDRMLLRTDLRHLHSLDTSHDNLTYALGISYLFAGNSSSKSVKISGPDDGDGDGVNDYNDRCPGTPLGVQVDILGCAPDTDRDGIADYKDRCPDTPLNTIVGKRGCPIINDSDVDGINDEKDKCPDTPEGVKVDQAGCPVLSDRDGDGVPDNLDRCKDTPKGAVVNIEGCWIVENLHFDAGKWNIKTVFYTNLDRVVNILQENPQLKIEIQGHTDNKGRALQNKWLSEKRAYSVLDYLKRKNINPARLTARGFGSTRPIAPNNTEEGRSMNRRVQFKSIR